MTKFTLMVLAAFVAAIALQAHVAQATMTVSEDGSWWSYLSHSQQIAVVEAEIDGYSYGYADGYLSGYFKNKPNDFSGESSAQSKQEPTFSKTFGFYRAAITDFYERHAGSSHLTVAEVIPCLADDPAITCNQVAKLGADK